MKLVAIGTLVLLGLFAVSNVAPAVAPVGDAAAVECEDVWLGEEIRVDACEAVCAVGDKLLKAECLE